MKIHGISILERKCLNQVIFFILGKISMCGLCNKSPPPLPKTKNNEANPITKYKFPKIQEITWHGGINIKKIPIPRFYVPFSKV
jgi:hypothetical protein